MAGSGRLRGWRWQGPCLHLRLKTHLSVAAVAKRLILGVATPAEANGRPARQVKNTACGIANGEFSFHSNRAIVVNRDFRQTALLSMNSNQELNGNRAQLADWPAPPTRCASRRCTPKGLTSTRITITRNTREIAPCSTMHSRRLNSILPS